MGPASVPASALPSPAHVNDIKTPSHIGPAAVDSLYSNRPASFATNVTGPEAARISVASGVPAPVTMPATSSVLTGDRSTTDALVRASATAFEAEVRQLQTELNAERAARLQLVWGM